MTQKKAIETNKIIVLRVTERGCTCAVNGATKDITWDALDEAASSANGDTELRGVYRQVRDEARRMVSGNKALPITAHVQQDHTNVWWVASFSDVAGEWHWIPRAAAEGGTLAHEWMAKQEAKNRAMQLRAMGYVVRGA